MMVRKTPTRIEENANSEKRDDEEKGDDGERN